MSKSLATAIQEMQTQVALRMQNYPNTCQHCGKREATQNFTCPICKGWHLTSQAKRKPSIRRGNGVQGSADPGQPTHLMQPQTVPVTKAKERS